MLGDSSSTAKEVIATGKETAAGSKITSGNGEKCEMRYREYCWGEKGENTREGRELQHKKNRPLWSTLF